MIRGTAHDGKEQRGTKKGQSNSPLFLLFSAPSRANQGGGHPQGTRIKKTSAPFSGNHRLGQQIHSPVWTEAGRPRLSTRYHSGAEHSVTEAEERERGVLTREGKDSEETRSWESHRPCGGQCIPPEASPRARECGPREDTEHG